MVRHGMTILLVEHDMPAVMQISDRVVVLDAGRIVEHGSHAQLLEQGGLYARLHAMQFRT